MDKPTLVIEFDPQSGNIGVKGPIQNKLLCYGLLELAKDAIRKLETDEPAIVPANGDAAERFRSRG